MKSFVILLSLFSLSAFHLQAQNNNKGYLTGNLESNTNYYVDDTKTGALAPSGHFGSNNYLKLDYYGKNLSVGVQLESYQPVLVGYPSELDGTKLTNYYATWRDEDFTVTAGTFYEQFGSGLLFRSWEDRALGLNNAVMGVRASYNYKDYLNVKVMAGAPRLGMDIAKTKVYGGDASFAISNLLGWKDMYLALEGSFISKVDEELNPEMEYSGVKPYTNGFSGRANWEWKGFSAKAEYVDAGKKAFINPFRGVDDNEKDYTLKNGNAQLIELGYNKGGLGVNVTGRRLAWMKQSIVYDNTSTSNIMNYVPAMCTQYTYMLTTLHPYSSITGDIMGGYHVDEETGDVTLPFINPGEMGGQIDVFYNFKRGTALGGKRGTKVHANFSSYYAIDGHDDYKAGNLLYRDFSVDVEKQWTRDFKMVLLYSYQEYQPSYGARRATKVSNIGVADLLYKINKKLSTRLELQYLNSLENDDLTASENTKDWMAALLEVNFAPRWSVWGSDMYNHGNPDADQRIHYYNMGVSYAKSRTRIALGYGRYKAGYICSGGVCRTIPAYTGGNLSITTSF